MSTNATSKGVSPAAWSGDYGGVPPFSSLKVEEFEEYIKSAAAAHTVEIDVIVRNKEKPTFDNTIAALESSGAELHRMQAVWDMYTSSFNNEQVQGIDKVVAPLLSAHEDSITQNAALFERIAAVYETRESTGLSTEQQRLVFKLYTSMANRGARLDEAGKAKLSSINQQLVKLQTQFAQNVLADENDIYVELNTEEDFAGLSKSFAESCRAAAKAQAEKKGSDESKQVLGIVLNTRSAVEPFLESSTNRALREKVWRNFASRGDNDNKNNNSKIIMDIVRLRRERAVLLGFKTHSHAALVDQMIGTPEAALELMESIWPAAVARVHEEVKDMQSIADSECDRAKSPRFTIEGWDYRHFAEKVRKLKYDIDLNDVQPYLQLHKWQEALFFVAKNVFGLEFTGPLKNVPVPSPDFTVYEVLEAETKKRRGLWYFDPYARKFKTSGAWMMQMRSQSTFAGSVTAIVTNTCNYMRASGSEPITISWVDARTMLHEFGHALHGLSSQVAYPSMSGTNVPTDYVEFPSQLLENYMTTPELLQKFAVNSKGEPVPQELIAKIKKSDTFNQGFATVEYLSSALLDMHLHLLEPGTDPKVFEQQQLERLKMPKEMIMRHRLPHFQHVFSTEQYASRYYAYLYSETLVSDAWEYLKQKPYDAALTKALREHVFLPGDSRDQKEAYRAFRGQDPDPAALMRARGFPVTSKM